MVFYKIVKKKTNKKKRFIAHKTSHTSYRRYKTGLSMTYGPMKPYLFKRSCLIPSLQFVWSISNQAPVYLPSAGDLPNFSEFTALYDEYKINKIKLNFECLFNGRDMNSTNPTSGTASLLGSLKRIRVVRDYNDNTALASENSAFEYQNCRSYAVGKSFKIVLYPRLLTINYRSAVSSSYTSTKPKYIDTTDTATPHYGLKFFLPSCTSDINDGNLNKQLYTCRATYFFSCKNVK